MTKYLLIFFSLFLLFNCSKETSTNDNFSMVPFAKEISLSNKVLSVNKGIKIHSDNEELLKLQILIDEYQELFIGTDKKTDPIFVELLINSKFKEEEYNIKISEKDIKIEGKNYNAFVYAINTILQLIDEKNQLSIGEINDSPDYNYRGLMIDLSRNWHDVFTLKQTIKLASWYKINYLQLHLTDDALFTFQSDTFPKLASKKSYTKEELKELNEFAKVRGVVLVPEIDVPGHSSGFIRSMPELFGLNNVASNPYTLNMGSEKVYEALDVLLTEVSAAFPYSPYIHLGGDEVFAEGFLEDAEIQEYMRKNHIENVEELYRHFLVRVTDLVKKKNKIPMLWSGFERSGEIKIPKDVIIMNWKPADYFPEEMIADGYNIINASWQPLYVVNNRKWSSEEIYNWSVLDWKGSATPNKTTPLKALKSEQILGGSMSVWEQNQIKLFSSLQKRLPAIAEKMWNSNQTNFENFNKRMFFTNSKIEQLVFPFTIEEDGLMYSNLEPNFSENSWFQDSILISLKPFNKNIKLQYSLENITSKKQITEYKKPFYLNKHSKILIKAFKDDKQIGETMLKEYRLTPVKLIAEGLVKELQPNSWEKHKFLDSVKITLLSKLQGKIKYTLNGTAPNLKSFTYKAPFYVKKSGTLRTRLFNDLDEEIGSERSQEYEHLQQEKSLTTNKPVTTSNKYESGTPEMINDGKIARWDHWGAHTNGNNWVIIDLEEEKEISKFKTYTFWDNYRYYEYTIDVSLDGENWKTVVDQSNNRQKSIPEGQIDIIKPTRARYLKLKIIRNSSNPGLHLVEFQAFE